MARKLKWSRLNRTIHYWGSILCAIPILIVLVSGVLLLLKKDIHWIQPPTVKGQSTHPTISFDKLLTIANSVSETSIKSWEDIDRLDIRPGKGVIKLRTKDNWEVQIDQQTGAVLQVAYRRSDFIESLHDGSFFHDKAKLWIFLPSALILLILWITGMYLFITLTLAKQKSKRKSQELEQQDKKFTSRIRRTADTGIITDQLRN